MSVLMRLSEDDLDCIELMFWRKKKYIAYRKLVDKYSIFYLLTLKYKDSILNKYFDKAIKFPLEYLISLRNYSKAGPIIERKIQITETLEKLSMRNRIVTEIEFGMHLPSRDLLMIISLYLFKDFKIYALHNNRRMHIQKDSKRLKVAHISIQPIEFLKILIDSLILDLPLTDRISRPVVKKTLEIFKLGLEELKESQ